VRPFEDDENEDWKGSQYFGQILTQTGRGKLRETIRKELKERHEGRARWLAWVTPLIAIAGIVATLLTRR
jgi:hypothetical protein